jgi:hypothetical protein
MLAWGIIPHSIDEKLGVIAFHVASLDRVI